MKKKHQRLLKISLMLLSISAGLGLFFTLFKDAMVFYYTPSEIPKNLGKNQTIRLGGIVKKGSHNQQGIRSTFILHDAKSQIAVVYEGILPSLFKEGTAAVVRGYFANDTFQAQEVLAKHDENYHPPNLKDVKK